MILDNEALDDLQLEGLMLIQKKDGFKFGIDAVLLSDFAKDAPSKCTLDLCTGTGIVPLLLSAKTKTAKIYGLEIQQDIADMAKRSVEYNKLSERVEIKCGDLKEAHKIYHKGSFDKITCNPPYMKNNSALKNTTDTKTISRHEIMCTLEDVISASAALLCSKGRFFMVHRPSRLADIMYLMRKYRLEPKRLRLIAPSMGKAPNLLLIEGMKDGGAELKCEPTLYIYDSNGNYSEEINKIYNRGL